MAENDGDGRDRRKIRGRKHAPVIESTAVEIPQPAEPAADMPVVEPDAPDPQAEAMPEQASAASEPEAVQAPEQPPEPQPEIIVPPPPTPEKPHLALPLAAAGLFGALFGAGAGSIVPGLFGGAPQVDAARVQRLEQGLATLAARPAPTPPPAPSNAAEVQALQQRLAAMEAEVKRRLDGQDQTLAARPAPTPGQPAPQVDLRPLTGRLDAVDRALAALDQKAEAARVAAGEGVKAVEPQLRELSARLTQTAQRVEATAAAPLYGAVQSLNQAFQRGAPFTVEVAALEVLGVKPDQLQSLKALAAKGAPSAQQIGDAFRPLAMQAAKAGQPAAGGLQAIFDGVVRTRATGPGAADTPDGLVAAIESALKGGDVGAALAAWARLPEPARKATEAWAATAREREAAAKAIRDIQDMALAALKKAAP
jgi:hypothetical protein